jgi:RND family efflux transporter MFP subunit
LLGLRYQNLTLVQQKIVADLQAGRNLITQAEQNVNAAQSALVAAQAETILDTVKQADIGDARALLIQAEANLTTAKGNTAQNVLKQQDIRQAQEAVRAVQQQVAYAQAQMDKTLIRSPLSGTVLQMAAQQGETLAAGLSSPTLIVVADLNRLQVDAYVDETDIGKVKIGQSVAVTVDAFPNKRFEGHVTKIASGSTIQQGVITYDVTIALNNSERQLKPDMTASVTIQTGKRSNVLLIPSEAIKTGADGMTVNVLSEKDGKSATASRKVATGGADGVNTEIRDGLKEGETVILAGMIKPTGPARQGASSPFGGAGGRGGGGGSRR